MADSIKIGSLDISAFKVGSSDCKIYLGDTLLYPNQKYPFGFYRQLRDGSEYTVSCSSSEDTITSAQTRSGLTNTQVTGSTQNAKNPVSVIFGDCCSTIGYGACLSWRWLSSVTISNSVTSIGNSVFAGCHRLTNIDIPNSITSIGDYTFQQCSGLTSVIIPDSVTSISKYAFAACYSLTSVIIPDSVTSIGNYVFQSCTSITSCTIGSGVTSIGDGAYGWCSSLSSITVNATTPPALGTNVFNDTNRCPIYVPSGSVSAYKAASGWSSYASRIQAISPTPTHQWVSYNEGDTIPASLIYGVKLYLDLGADNEIDFQDSYQGGGGIAFMYVADADGWYGIDIDTSSEIDLSSYYDSSEGCYIVLFSDLGYGGLPIMYPSDQFEFDVQLYE